MAKRKPVNQKCYLTIIHRKRIGHPECNEGSRWILHVVQNDKYIFPLYRFFVSSSMWHTYILECSDDSLYTGVTTDIERRVEEHNSSPKGATYTKSRRPVKLVWSRSCRTRSSACKKEWEIKQLTREEKLKIFIRA